MYVMLGECLHNPVDLLCFFRQSNFKEQLTESYVQRVSDEIETSNECLQRCHIEWFGAETIVKAQSMRSKMNYLDARMLVTSTLLMASTSRLT
jgi:hypothetical protein